jgi:hypothetical protein
MQVNLIDLGDKSGFLGRKNAPFAEWEKGQSGRLPLYRKRGKYHNTRFWAVGQGKPSYLHLFPLAFSLLLRASQACIGQATVK